jgi:Flp pilus assembly CpaE family ATPase
MSPTEAGEIAPASVQPLAASLRQAFPLTVLDLPSLLSGTTAVALTSADRVLLIVTPDVASLQSTVVALQALSTIGVDDDRIWLVLNTPGGVGGLSPEAVSRSLKRSPVATIPYEPGMPAALNARRPLMLTSPKSAAAQAIGALAAQLLS